nr:hypothetical protein CRG98_025527 [Ipomoea trifida]
MPTGLPPIRGIEHQIDLVPGAPIPNRPAYRCSPDETKEIQKQVEELLSKGHVRENEADSWTNFATEGEDVEDNAGQTNGMQDPLQVTGGPITRERAKRLQGALNGLMHKLNNNKTELWELGEKSEAKYVNVIAVQD